MSDWVKTQTHVGCLVARTVLGRSGKSFQREVERLIDHNGPEWVVTRSKAIWNAANHLRNGDRESARQVYQENSIAYHRNDMTPKGPFRPAVRGYVLAQRPSVVKRHAAVLRFYTSVVLPELTDAQSRKAYEAITSVSYFSILGRGMARSDLAGIDNPVLRSLMKQQDWCPAVKQRYADSLHASSYYYSSVKIPRQMRGEPYAAMALSFITEPWLPEVLDQRTPCQEMRQHLRTQLPGKEVVAGRITTIQEQGGKARVVAMPTSWLQLAFSPLHRRLADIAEHAFPEASCVRDQLKGVHGVLRHMQEGKPVFCTDLSSATDRFPRSYSLEILSRIGMKDYAEALEQVCSMPFESPWGPVQYGTGQPMGLYGSFPLFHLSHLIVADSAERSVRDRIRLVEADQVDNPIITFQTGKCYYVLGDDIVFSDERVASAYRVKMEHLKVPISEHKSFGGNLAEFAGFMVTHTSKGVVAFRPYKSPSGTSISNPISFLDSLGSKASAISPYWSKQWTRFQATAGHRALDLSPLVPINDGAARSNPYRGDSQTLVTISSGLTTLIGESLPDLSGSTKINTIPLFHERGMFDFYGFNPSELKADEKVIKDQLRRRVAVGISNDPVLKLYEDPPESSVQQTTQVPPSSSNILDATNLVKGTSPISEEWKREIQKVRDESLDRLRSFQRFGTPDSDPSTDLSKE